MKAGNE